jgi:hypothetical protein
VNPGFDEVQEWGGEAWNEKVPGIFPEAVVVWKLESKKTRMWELNTAPLRTMSNYMPPYKVRHEHRQLQTPTGTQISPGNASISRAGGLDWQ